MPKFFMPVVLAISLSLAACGGDSDATNGTSSNYQSVLQQETSARAQAVALGVSSPCDTAQQCGLLTFHDTDEKCSYASYQPYSLVSPTASAASAAAADEIDLAGQAVIAAPQVTACVTAIVAPPALACVANACQAAP